MTPPPGPAILAGMDHAAALAVWGYAQGDPRLIGAAVILVGAAAIGYVVRRVWQVRRERRR